MKRKSLSASAEALRLAIRERFGGASAFARASGIPESTIRHFLSGRRLPNRATRARMRTALRAAEREGAGRPPAASDGREPQGPTEAGRHAASVGRALGGLVRELEYFRRSGPEARERLRALLPSRDVGYAVALLKALYDEDAFEQWVRFARYTPAGRMV